MKATLTFELPEEEGEFKQAVAASDIHAALWDVANDVFRPARKHGYPDNRLQKLLQAIDAADLGLENKDAGTELIHLLEAKFFEILSDRGVKL